MEINRIGMIALIVILSVFIVFLFWGYILVLELRKLCENDKEEKEIGVYGK